MRDYILRIRTTAAAPSPELTFMQPSDKMAIDYAKRVLAIYGRADWVMGGDLFGPNQEARVMSFETQRVVTVKELP